MSYSKSTSTQTSGTNHTNSQEKMGDDVSSGHDTMMDEAELNLLLEQAEDWIRDNQTVAMLGGFGLGVFIGVLLRR